MDKAALLARIERDLAQEPELARACSAVVFFLESQPPEILLHLTFASLGRAAGLGSAVEAMPVAEYLSSSRIDVLQKCFVLVLGDDEVEISSDQVWEANATRVLYHPDTGEEVPDFEKFLYMYFAPGAGAREIVGRAV